MDISGLTHQQNGLQVASNAVATPAPRPRTSSPDPAPPAPAPAPAETTARAPDSAVADALVAQRAANTASGARIHVDEATDRIVVQIVNADDEVIKQLPPEEVLKIAARLQEVTGLIFDQQV